MNSSNLLGLNFELEASRMPRLESPIFDAHLHITGKDVLPLFKQVADLYGIKKFLTMTPLEDVEAVQDVFGHAAQFNTIPKFFGADPLFEHGPGYVERIKAFHAKGARVAKFWCAPRIYELIPATFANHPLRIDSQVRRASIDVAVELGMKLMVHIADPNTWFATKYRDEQRYGSKRAQYDMLEWLLDTYKVPTIAAHMGGSPEDLDFLDALLSRHKHLYLDSSAMKWQVRELSLQTPERRRTFFKRWQGRILFGSDIVTSDQHFYTNTTLKNDMGKKASNHQEAFDLYASRYYCLRKLFETNDCFESPVADPDLQMIADAQQLPKAKSAPTLIGAQLEAEQLRSLYADAVEGFFNL